MKRKDPTIVEKVNTCRFAERKEGVIDLQMWVCTVSVEMPYQETYGRGQAIKKARQGSTPRRAWHRWEKRCYGRDTNWPRNARAEVVSRR
jgi:hypothetical protein